MVAPKLRQLSLLSLETFQPTPQPALWIPVNSRCQLSPEAVEVVETSVEAEGIVEIVVTTEETRIIQIIAKTPTPTKTKTQIHPVTRNLIKRVQGILTGLQIPVAPGTGPKAGERPTAPTP